MRLGMQSRSRSILTLGTLFAAALAFARPGDSPAHAASAVAMCTPGPAFVTVFPAEGAASVPTNARLLFKHYSSYLVAASLQVRANGVDVPGTFVQIADAAVLLPAWTEFRPSANFPAGAMVTAVVGTASNLEVPQSTLFQIGEGPDATAPSGGQILGSDSFFVRVGALGENLYDFTLTVNAANDTGGPAWAHATMVLQPPAGPSTTQVRIIEGSTYDSSDGPPQCSEAVVEGTTVTVTVYAFDLAGNEGAEYSHSFVVGPSDDSAGLCRVTPRSGSLSGFVASLAALALLARRRS